MHTFDDICCFVEEELKRWRIKLGPKLEEEWTHDWLKLLIYDKITNTRRYLEIYELFAARFVIIIAIHLLYNVIFNFTDNTT